MMEYNSDLFTRGRVLNGELYTHRLQKLIYLYLSTGYKYRHINSCNLCVYDAIYMLLSRAWDPCRVGMHA